MTPRTIIQTARYIASDTGVNVTVTRQSDAELLLYVKHGLQEMAVLRPDLFAQVGTMTCEPGAVEQAVTFLDAQRVIEVLGVTGGRAVTPMDRAVMDLFRPTWRQDPPAAAENWAPLEGDPLRFLIYPPAPAAQSLDIRYTRLPAAVGLDDTIGDVPSVYESALADYVIYRVDMKDDEHAVSARASAHYAAFKTKLGVNDAIQQ